MSHGCESSIYSSQVFKAIAIVSIAVLTSARAVAATYFVEQQNPAAADGNDGSEARPWKTTGRGVQALASPGDRLLIGAGIYREAITIAASGTADNPVRIEAELGAMVVVTGADALGNWHVESAESAIYSTAWDHVFIGWNPHRTHPDDTYHQVIGRAEQVFAEGLPLRQVLERRLMSRGTFYVDEATKRMDVCLAGGQDLTKDGEAPRVEAAVRSVLWDCRGSYVMTKGLRFRYAANRAQEGAAVFSGRGNQVADCVFEKTNGVGAVFTGEDIQVRTCIFVENGQLGFSANKSHRLRMSDCTVRGNNAKGFDRGWEAGGTKLVLCRGAILENSTFVENHGPGIWFDIGNEDCEVRNCLIANNEDAGIFDEISFGLQAHDNVVLENGLADTPGSWGAGGGICVSSAPGAVIERNLLLGNREGISFREQKRTTPRIDAKQGSTEESVWNHDEIVRHNVLAFNRDAQLWGWFDMDDERNWPAKTQEQHGRPISLESLHFNLSNNIYGAAGSPPGGLFHWGTSWKRNTAWNTPDEVYRAIGLEQNSKIASIQFADYAARDLRVPADSRLLTDDCYPHGTVPEVKLSEMPHK